ncbi:hypothetical protein DICPUDRAFT_159691 [Dictyostelium purpureum]|uniref:ABC transporter C family protein n=1 Tax=Dictyostelium purpureum TaxID=5786 RepID=F1A4R3_DICPU|nr:uncharacterized protein DICPUDRAFT_159691 [Dictyostelium purpureum]EGC28816.1 hypothetical protein DICPUDRAFT_159691 [Dictyostelium purpureum]|eukprot:XP_003294658.1 hypothetical protein DICPUDRAFT_159691 [Dictyostelium purpureum]
MIRSCCNNIKSKFSYSLLSETEDTDLFNEPCPEDNASVWQKLTFNWAQPMLFKGYRRALQMTDISDIPEEIKVEHNSPYLANIDYNDGKYPLIKHIYKEFIPRNKKLIAYKLSGAILSVITPMVLKYFLRYIQLPPDQKEVSYGLFLCFLLFMVTSVLMIGNQYSYWFGMKSSLQIRGALISAIYEKMLRLSNSARREFNSGNIMNLVSVDVGAFQDFFWNNHTEIFIFPFQILALLILLCIIIGFSGLVGFLVMVISVPLTTALSTQASKYLRLSLGHADTRTDLTSELINGIRFLKLYAWEKLFLDRIDSERTKQLDHLYTRIIYYIVSQMIVQISSALVLISTFATYSLLGHQLTLDIAFTSMVVFVNLRRPSEMLPQALFRLFGLLPSSKRIEEFLQSPEIQDSFLMDGGSSPIVNTSYSYNVGGSDENNSGSTSPIYSLSPSQMDIKITNATFDWNEHYLKGHSKGSSNDLVNLYSGNTNLGIIESSNIEEDSDLKELIMVEHDGEGSNESADVKENFENYVLNNIDFIAPAGKLTIICGRVGSGKTSLVSALIGEIYRVSGSVQMPPTISFTTQQSFLISASLRENILFGKPFDLEYYKKVIEACSLTPDLLQLSAKDLTEIGERGINLSGGQKQRISLARALYTNADCFIMDEPLSAVDPEVGKHLFDHCIQGLMRNKTRILVTHQLQFIPSADHIVVVENGKITQGTYQELKQKGIDFESIMKTKKLESEEEENKKNSAKPSAVTQNTTTPVLNIDDIISKDEDPNLMEKAKLLVKEDRNSGAVGFDIYKSYVNSGSSLPFFTLTCIIYIVSQVIFQVSDFWLQVWTQKTPEDPEDKFYILVYMGFIVAFIFALTFRYFFLARISFASARKLHDNLLYSVSFASCQFFDTNPSGRILNRFSKDISDIDLTLLECISDVLYCGSTVVIAIGMMIFITPAISIPFAFLVGIYYFIQKVYRASSRELKRMESISRSPVFSLFQETYNGLITIRSYQQQIRFLKLVQNNINVNLRLFFYSFSVHRWIGIRLELISSLVVLFASVFTIFSNNPGLSALAVTTSLSMTSYLNWTIRQYTELEVKMNSVERVLSYVSTPAEGIRFTEEKDNDEQGDIKMDRKWPTNGEIEFKDVEIKYRPTAEPSLRNFTCKINKNEKIGIVGRTGAGKSTISQGLFRMVESSKGSIFIDGVDISKIGLYNLRSSIGIIPQDPFIFSGSLRLNIDPFGEYSDIEIWDALEKVRLKDQIQAMPLKLDSKVQEGGDGLSVGQKQLLCLSRAILKNSKILFCDECTASLDYESDAVIKKTIRENFKDCTILTIAHRIDTIYDSDRIIVVDKGQLAEFDSPENLLKNPNSRFSKLVKYQTDFYNESTKKF